ncbi:uncharacterized protein LOC120348732 isoform X3 [Nilaparvata lugens]|uniref:uncharacterized protein LOC120348732 isoform X3 n=1 Tax=Nilaparvata lugens TaxID=108931 RepID=UPI00193DDBA7|nr:uncharacterized protein LOC120348732 isoform X3 [Nilaparvata lugens]
MTMLFELLELGTVELTGKLQLHRDDDIHFGTRNYQCHQGRDTNEYQKRKYAQLRDKMAQEDHCFFKRYKQAQTTKMLGCSAKVQVTRIIKMFQYKVSRSQVSYSEVHVIILAVEKGRIKHCRSSVLSMPSTDGS